MPNYVPARVATTKLGVCLATLLRWEEGGKIKTIKTPNGQRRYDIDSVIATGSINERSVILYARVSGHRQKPDLERQASFLLSQFPEAELVTEVGSGLNYKRKKLLAILERVLAGNVRLLVVGHKDRLSRFGFDFFQWLCGKFNCKIVVLNQTNLSPEREMVEDILAIVHVFSCRLYGLRKYKQTIHFDNDLPTIKTDSKPIAGKASFEVGKIKS
jgi:putative resolvase